MKAEVFSLVHDDSHGKEGKMVWDLLSREEWLGLR